MDRAMIIELMVPTLASDGNEARYDETGKKQNITKPTPTKHMVITVTSRNTTERADQKSMKVREFDDEVAASTAGEVSVDEREGRSFS